MLQNIDDKNENIQSNINLEKDIKSFYMLKSIFSFIDYKKELEPNPHLSDFF